MLDSTLVVYVNSTVYGLTLDLCDPYPSIISRIKVIDFPVDGNRDGSIVP